MKSTLEFPEILLGKRILLATESFGPVNGVSRTTLKLIEYLRGNGVNVAVCAPATSGGQHRDFTSNVDIDGQIEVRLKGRPLPYNPELSVVYPVRLSSLYSRTFGSEPDLIYLASPASLGFQILLQLRLQPESSRPPLLLNFQTDLSGYCEILFPFPLDAWAVWVFRKVQGYLFRHSSVRTIFYPSSFVHRYLRRAGVQDEKMANLRRGVDGQMFNPIRRSSKMRRQQAPNGEIILVTVARLGPEKGFQFLAEVASRLHQRGFRFKLLIVGGNRNPQVEADIRNLFGRLHSEEKVVFTGFLKGEELARIYACGDIFLHCSITETFGLVVLESMASGVPVIARDEGGPSEIVANGKSGYLLAPGDLSGFVEKVIQLGEDPDLRSIMGLESRRMAEEATWESIGNKVAWKLAKELDTRDLVSKTQISQIPSYSWLLFRLEIRLFLVSFLADVRLLWGIGIIVGVWCGLVMTWILVQLVTLIRGWKPWALIRYLQGVA